MTMLRTDDWQDLFDIALFEPNRAKLRLRIEKARLAINKRLDALVKEPSQHVRSASEHIALRDALATLTELQNIVYARKPNVSAGGQSRTAS
jgi:hypothetical protein